MKFYIHIIILFVLSTTWAQKDIQIMPWPKEVVTNDLKLVIKPSFHVNIEGEVNPRIYNAATRFLRRLNNKTGTFITQGYVTSSTNIQNPGLLIQIDSIQKEPYPPLQKDESYNLEVRSDQIILKSKTDYGAIYGLETLLQLVDYSEDYFYFQGVSITDQPRFTWRGLMIDCARHYQPLNVIKRNLDAMAAVKLNVFHWHLTDDQGFRIESKKHPQLHLLGSHGQYYTQEEIKHIVNYASDRGIRVIPEIDVPGHASAILTAYPELGSKAMTYEIEKYAGIFDPTLDPTNEKTYEVLEDVFSELAALFPDEYVHIGGDENEGKHWDENENIQQFKIKNNLKSNHELQVHFNIKLQKILKKYNKKMMGWEEIMDAKIDKSAIIHSWRGVNEGVTAGQSLLDAVNMGYQTVLSNGYYIDLMYSVDDHYLVDPLIKADELSTQQQKMILGGEATMWSELVTPLTIDSRIWPRTAAIAERFWSPSNVKSLDDMHTRLEKLSLHLEDVGITHIRNQAVILRNICKNENIAPLLALSKVCEPLKKYSRNAGGTEYESYAPFTLFADACNADAPHAKKFKKIAEDFIKNTGNKEVQEELYSMLDNWIILKNEMNTIHNPIINTIKPISENLSQLSINMLSFLKESKLNEVNWNASIENAKQPIVDVELAVIQTFIDLYDYVSKKQNTTIKISEN